MLYRTALLDIVAAGVVSIPVRTFVEDVSAIVNYEFIDEIFHYPQFMTIYNGEYWSWDPKITTPPGLYYLTSAFTKILNIDPTLQNARFVNFIGGLFLTATVFMIRQKSKSPGFTSAAIFLNPLLSIFYSLYYTDVWASAIVVAAYAVIVYRPMNSYIVTSWISAILGLISLTFRQTNIAWCIFLLAVLIDSKVKDEKLYTYEHGHGDFLKFVKTALKNIGIVIPYALVAGLFVGFGYVNGGIALGDKENHILVPHLTQLCYCVSFITLFTVPIWISYDVFGDYISDNLLNMQGLIFNAAWIPCLFIIVQNFTIIHPFLLADNRHYSFYIIKNFVARTETSRLELIPIYHFSFYMIYKLFVQNSNIGQTVDKETGESQDQERTVASPMLLIFYFFATSVSIVFSPLFEPRYYIIPYIIFRLFVRPIDSPLFNHYLLQKYNTSIRYVAEVMWLSLWTQALYTIFMTLTFKWPDQEHLQRIIW